MYEWFDSYLSGATTTPLLLRILLTTTKTTASHLLSLFTGFAPGHPDRPSTIWEWRRGQYMVEGQVDPERRMYWGATKLFDLDWNAFRRHVAGLSDGVANYAMCLCRGTRCWGEPKIKNCKCCPGPDGYVYFKKAHQYEVEDEERAFGRAKRPLRDPHPRRIREMRWRARYGWATYNPIMLNREMVVHCQWLGNLNLVREYTMVRTKRLCIIMSL